MDITQEYILSISPDASSTKNANKIFSKTTWEVKRSERAVWSEIYGSGKKPYLVQIDTQEIAFKCSCPSRKFPCKHGLALGLYLAENSADTLSQEEEPLWVKEWIDKRTSKAKTKASKPLKIKSEVSIKKTEEKKWSNAKEDVLLVELWLHDVIKLGILDFPNKEADYWEDLKKRMVDIKLSGFNGFFSQLQNLDYSQTWEQKVLKLLAQIHQLVVCVKHHETLENDFKKELAMLLGWTPTKKELLSNEKNELIDDVWMVINVTLKQEESLNIRKVYLYGTTTNRWAYILEFAHGNSYFEEHYLEGSLIQAKLVFYDGIFKQRAFLKIKGAKNSSDFQKLKTFEDLTQAHQHFKEELIHFPWIFDTTLFISKCNVVQQENKFYLVDKNNTLLYLESFTKNDYYNFLIQSEGVFVDIFLLHNQERSSLLGFFKNNEVISL